ncbi:MAG TPA: acetyl-CoA decarbonylase/synthase complex subunit gamma [Thermoleophilia bacterium]|nr:acetyl-CoA decarbonylase/synthase complex subunit gamma [Thermoleophilia bacterium]
MALTGLQIYKLLPRTNCKECGFPTCLAFAMKLAQKGTELDKCPYVSDEAKTELDAASAPPIKLVAIGAGDRAFEIGNETVLFRHEKTFFHQAGLVVRVKSDDPQLAEVAGRVGGYGVERVGMQLTLDGLAVEHTDGDAAAYAAAVAAARAAAPGLPLVLMSLDAAAIDAALAGGAAADRPLVHAATAANWESMAEVAKKHGCPLAIRVDGGDLSGLAELSEQVRGAGVEDIMLDPGTTNLAGDLAAFTQLRRLALKKGARALGFPIVAVATATTWQAEMVRATQAIAKYAGVVIVDHDDPGMVYPLLTLRQNIYTDPQKPIQVEPKLYEIGTAGADSPVLITTNFSLTYFSVSGEVEGAGMPAWLLVADSDGQSVLTGWAAGKFDAEKIAKTVKDSGIADKVSHKKLVIPGHVAGLSGEVEEELPGWQIMVGPRDAVDIPSYLKTVWSA